MIELFFDCTPYGRETVARPRLPLAVNDVITRTGTNERIALEAVPSSTQRLGRRDASKLIRREAREKKRKNSRLESKARPIRGMNYSESRFGKCDRRCVTQLAAVGGYKKNHKSNRANTCEWPSQLGLKKTQFKPRKKKEKTLKNTVSCTLRSAHNQSQQVACLIKEGPSGDKAGTGGQSNQYDSVNSVTLPLTESIS